MSSIHLSTYADLACANTCVYLGEKVRETVKQGDTEGGREVREGKGREGKGREADLSIKGDHILATEPLSRD